MADKWSAAEQEASKRAEEVREVVGRWLARRSVTAPVIVSPFVTNSGEPRIAMQMNANLAAAIFVSLAEQDGEPPPQPPAREDRPQASPPRSGPPQVRPRPGGTQQRQTPPGWPNPQGRPAPEYGEPPSQQPPTWPPSPAG